MNKKSKNILILVVCCTKELKFEFDEILETITIPFEVRYVLDATEFLQLLNEEKKVDKIDHCFFLAEIDWNKDLSITSFQGFDVANKLRVKGIKCPFHFFSLSPKGTFYPEEKPPLFSLLRAKSFHHLYQLPFSTKLEDLTSQRRMTNQLWEDVVSSLVGVRGLIREELHDLKNACINFSDNLKQLQVIFTISFERLSPIVGIEKKELLLIKKEFWTALKLESQKEKQSNVLSVIDDFSSRIISLSPPDLHEETQVVTTSSRWKVLLVEDEENVRTKLAEAFERNNIQVILVSSGEEAFVELDKDKYNHIVVLLCDIRLYEKTKNQVWQTLQGYDIIRKVYREYENMIAFFVLTSARNRMMALKKDFNFNIVAEYKKDVMGAPEAMNIFLRKIREKGDIMFFKSRSQPSGFGASAWEKKTINFYKGLGQFYREHISSIDYEEAEERINESVTNFVRNKSTDKKLNSYRVQLKPEPKVEEERLKLLDKFRSRILVGRRIALSFFIQGYTPDEIYKLMTKRKGTKDTLKFLFNSTLVLSFKTILAKEQDVFKAFKSQLLEEEIAYLETYFTYKTDVPKIRTNEKDNHILANVFENIKSWIENRPLPVKIEMKNKVEKLLSLRTDKISVKSFQEDFNLAKEVTNYYDLQLVFKEEILFDLDDIYNESVKSFLKKQIAT